MEPSVGQESSHEEKGHEIIGFERYYECEFCRRGFNTAQALGGHMNIHRKHRSKNNRPANVSNNQLQVGAKLSCNHHHAAAVSSYDRHRFKNLGDSTSHVMSYATCLPGGSGSSSLRKEPVDHYLSSSLEAKDDHVLEKSTQICMLNEENLDLELRLGYDH